MNNDLDILFTPCKIGNCEIKNRIVITSMGGTSIFGWMEPHHDIVNSYANSVCGIDGTQKK